MIQIVARLDGSVDHCYMYICGRHSGGARHRTANALVWGIGDVTFNHSGDTCAACIVESLIVAYGTPSRYTPDYIGLPAYSGIDSELLEGIARNDANLSLTLDSALACSGEFSVGNGIYSVQNRKTRGPRKIRKIVTASACVSALWAGGICPGCLSKLNGKGNTVIVSYNDNVRIREEALCSACASGLVGFYTERFIAVKQALMYT